MVRQMTKRERWRGWAKDIGLVVLGILLIDLALQLYLVPNEIVAGGVGGVGTVCYHVFGWSPALVIYGLNIPLLVLCWLALGKEAFYKTVLGSILFPTFLGMLSFLPQATEDLFLASVFGGMLTVAGVGLIFRANASAGGTAIPAQIIGEYTPLSFGTATLICDGSIVFLALLVFTPDITMYSLLAVIAMAVTVDMVKIGGERNLQIFVVSEKCELIAERIIKDLQKSVTLLDGEGGYSKQKRRVLLVVTGSRHYNALAKLIKITDPNAFFVVANAREVQGRHYAEIEDRVLAHQEEIFEQMEDER